jgi:hypothetical protein
MPKEGWIRGKLSGEVAFSDGSAMFIGNPQGKTWKRNWNGIDGFRFALKLMLSKRMEETELEARVLVGPKIFDMRCVKLRGGTLIQAKYFAYARKFKGGKLFLGKQMGTSSTERGVICKVGKKIVGAIMPVRA